MPGRLYLIDSNILIRWVQPEHPDFQTVQHAVQHLEDSEDTPCYTSQNLAEFWNVMTRHADRNGYGLSPEGALIRAEILESKFRLLPDNVAVQKDWRKLLVSHCISGIQIHDAAWLPPCTSIV